MVRANPISRSNRIHRDAKLQRFRNNPCFDLFRSATPTIRVDHHTKRPEKRRRSLHGANPSCSRTGMTSQKTKQQKTWGADTVYVLWIGIGQ
jgi:hypothetical protein